MQGEPKASPVLRYPAVLENLAKQLRVPKQTVKSVIEGLVSFAAEELKGGKRVQIGPLGDLILREVPAKDGEAGTRRRPVLVAAKKFKESVGQ